MKDDSILPLGLVTRADREKLKQGMVGIDGSTDRARLSTEEASVPVPNHAASPLKNGL